MKKAPFYKNLWFWLILVGVITLVGNISILIFVKGENQSAWLTLISGWISGIATLIVGIIAFKQNKQYISRKPTKKNDLLMW